MRARNRKSKITATGDYRKILKKQRYEFVGKHSCVQACGWTKKSLLGKGSCYKEKFYGIKSHRCCQMSPWITCQNKCLHCWRPMELEIKIGPGYDSPKEIIEGCIKAQKKLLTGFGGYQKTDQRRYKEAQEPTQFAISLIGEPTLYPKIAELILELRRQKKSSFLVSNGLFPERIKELQEKNALPTQLYISLLYPHEELFKEITQNTSKEAWQKFNKTLETLSGLNTRTVIRMTLIRELNSDKSLIESYAELIQKASPMFIEIKSYMAVGFSKNRKHMGFDKMLFHEEVVDFSKELLKHLPGYKYLDEKKESRVVLLGKDPDKRIIKTEEI